MKKTLALILALILVFPAVMIQTAASGNPVGRSELTDGGKYAIVAESGGKLYALADKGGQTGVGVMLDYETAENAVSIDTTRLDGTVLFTYSASGSSLKCVSTGRYIYLNVAQLFSAAASRQLTLEESTNGRINIRYNNYYVSFNGTNFVRSSTPTPLYFIPADDVGSLTVTYLPVDADGCGIADPFTRTYNSETTQITADEIEGYTFREARYGDLCGDTVNYIQYNGTVFSFKNEIQYAADSSTAPKTVTYKGKECLVGAIDVATNERTVDIYLVYSEDSAPGPNDHDHSEAVSEDFPYGAPDHNKRLEPNYAKGSWDGTYTLYLDVTGKAEMADETNKADVIVIYDTSNSMAESMTDSSGIARPRYEIACELVSDIASELLAYNDSDADQAVRIGLVSYASTAQRRFGYVSTLDDFTNGFAFAGEASTYQKVSYGGTNWEDALQTAKALFDADSRQDADQYVILISGGEPTCRATRGDWYVDLSAIECDMNGGTPASFTDPTNNNKQYYSYGYKEISNNTNFTGIGRCYTHAKDDAKAFVDAGAEFYAVALFSDDLASMANELVNYAYTGFDYPAVDNDNFKLADDGQVLHDEFAAVISAVTREYSYGNVWIEDKLTPYTMTAGELENGTPDFKYYKNETGAELVEWNEAPIALYNSTPGTAPEVLWDLSSVGMLEDGVTYTVSFTVWPDQYSNDALRNLNYHVDVRYKDYPPESDWYDSFANANYRGLYPHLVRDADDGYHFKVRSNEDALVHYEPYIVSNGEMFSLRPQTARYSYPTMESSSYYYMDAAIVWNDSISETNRFQSVILVVNMDGEYYCDVTLEASDADVNDPSRWVKQIRVSPGIYVEGEPYNEGHVYSFELAAYTDKWGTYHALWEEPYEDYRYEFRTEEVTPIINDGVFTLIGDENGDGALSGVFDLRGGVTLAAEGLSEGETADFMMRIDIPGKYITGYIDETPIYDENAYPLWYTVYTDVDRDGDYYGEADTNGVLPNADDLGGGWGTLYNNTLVTLADNQLLRVINVPVGMKIAFTAVPNEDQRVKDGQCIVGGGVIASLRPDGSVSFSARPNANNDVTFIFAPPAQSGDVNGDGVINMKDLKLLRNYLSGIADLGDLDGDGRDVDGDGIVNIKDLQALKRLIAD